MTEQLEEALAGRYVPGPQEGELRALVNLASEVGALNLPGPGELTRQRMRARFEQMLERDRDPWWVGLVGWLGSGPAPRPFAQRLAAGLVLVTVGGGAASAASGVSPFEATSGVMDFAGSVIRNLDPRDSSGNSASETPTPDASPSPGPSASATADPNSTETPPAGTPDPNATPFPGETPVAGEPTGTPGAPTGTAATVVATPSTSATPGQTGTETPETETPEPGTSTPPAATPTVDDDDFETETPDDGSDDNGGDLDRDDRIEPGDDRDPSDDDNSGSGSGGDDS